MVTEEEEEGGKEEMEAESEAKIWRWGEENKEVEDSLRGDGLAE